MLLKQAHGGTTKKRSYTTPSGVTQAQIIKGILPYSKPTQIHLQKTLSLLGLKITTCQLIQILLVD